MENGFQFAAAQEFVPFDIGFVLLFFVLLTTRRSHPSTLEIESQIPISNASNESLFNSGYKCVFFSGIMIVNVHFLFVLIDFIKTDLLVPNCSTKLYTLRYNMFRLSTRNRANLICPQNVCNTKR